MSTIGKEDIFESEGNTVNDSQTRENENKVQESQNPDIELVSVDIDEAMKKYQGRVLNLKSIDFSDAISKKRRHAFGNNQYVLEVAGSGYSGHETPSEKLNRILYEIADLNEQLKTDKSEESELLNDEVLTHLATEVKNLQNTKTSHGPTNVEPEADFPNKQNDPKACILENRLRRLEQVLGSSIIPSAPILDTIEDLKLRCETLNSSYVSGLEQRLNVILTKLGKVEESREKSEIDEDVEKKVADILEMMQKWDVSCSSLPSNVNKVKALNRLHEQAQHFASRLTHLKTVREKLEKEVTQGREAILEFETNGKQEMVLVVEKLKSLEASVANLK